MVEDKLPIKFFAKRKIDNMRVEGGPQGDDPSWVLSGDRLKEKASIFSSIFQDFEKRIKKKEEINSIIPFVFKAKINRDAFAKTHRKEISGFLDPGNYNNILGLVSQDELIVKLKTKDEAITIFNRLQNYDNYKYAISCFEGFKAFIPEENTSEETTDYKIKLIDFQDYEQNTVIRNLFEKVIKKTDLKFKKTHYTSNITIYNLQNIDTTVLDNFKQEEIFESIFSIEPMPKYRIQLDTIIEDHKIEIKLPQETVKYTTIGILDNGIKPIPHLQPWIDGDRWTVYPEKTISSTHGTFVAGITIYGDIIEEQNWVGVDKGVKIFDAVVFPNTKEGISEDELIQNIQEVISKNSNNVKIWNLSVSISRPIDTNSFSDFAIALDALQDEHNILICKSVGNCRNFITNHPKGKIYQGADSIRSLVVGSLAHQKGDNDLVEIDNPSPFTRIGPGPSFIIKPEISHYGGNAGVDEDGKITTTGVKSFSVDGQLSSGIGTSFSTPRIAALAAGIYQEMDEEFDPLLLKSLIIHSASYPSKLNIPIEERISQLGLGKPKTVNEIIYNSPHEATLILRDTIAKGEYIDIMDFPMPDCLINDGFYTGQIIVTLVYDPILEPSQGAEYCQSTIDIKLGTYDNKLDRDTSRRNIINPIGRFNSKNILLSSLYSKRTMRNNSDDFALNERLLIQYGNKFYPVKKYAIDLSELTEGNRIAVLGQEKNWYLHLRGLFRDHIESKALKYSSSLSQDYCLMITIRDPSNHAEVYTGVTQKLDEFNFWHNNIKVASDIEISV